MEDAMANGEKTAWEKIKESITNALKDAVTLDVVTLTGDIELSGNAGGSGLSPSDIFKAIKTKVETNARVVACTHIEVDFDTTVFVKDEAPENLLKLHTDSVKVAQDGRIALLKFFKSVLSV